MATEYYTPITYASALERVLALKWMNEYIRPLSEIKEPVGPAKQTIVSLYRIGDEFTATATLIRPSGNVVDDLFDNTREVTVEFGIAHDGEDMILISRVPSIPALARWSDYAFIWKSADFAYDALAEG